MKNIYVNGKSVPRWIILILDLVLISWSFAFSYFIIVGFEFTYMVRGFYLIYTALFCFIALPIMYLMKLHTGLLRYSNTTDMLRIFKALFFASAVYFLLAYPLSQSSFQIHKLVPLVIINFFVSSCLMIMMRIAAKSIFQLMAKRNNDKSTIRVLVFGSDKNAVWVKNALENSNEFNYEVEGFLDVSRNNVNSYMEQKKVYSIHNLARLKQEKKIDQIVIVNEDLGDREKNILLNRSLKYGLKVITVPPVESWLSGKLTKTQIKDLRIEDLLQRRPIKIDQTAVHKDIKGKCVLVTGAAGSIGSEIVRQVLSFQPSLLILCDNAESPLYETQMEIMEVFPNSNFEIVIGDVRNNDRMNKLFNAFHPEVVYHAAAYKHVPLMEDNPFEAIDANIHGTKILADLSIKYGVKKFVMISTDKAVNPTNIMGASKRIAEIYIQSLNENQGEIKQKNNLERGSSPTMFITTRFGNVLGSNGSVIPRFRHQIEIGGPITVTHKDITRYFMTIPEAVQLVLEAGTMGKGGEIFVFDMGAPVKIYELAKKMIQLAGLELDKDIKIVITGLRPGEKLYEELLNSEETTKPTYHEKIKIAKVRIYTYCEVKSGIDGLISMNENHDNDKVVLEMKKLVPEFKSKNSKYEKLDHLIENNLKKQTTFGV